MPTVHGVNASPFVRKVRVALAEKGVSYDHDPVLPMNVSAEYRKISPLGKIPAYSDGDKTLADSSVICAYIEKIHPTPALYPSDPWEYARALWFEEYGDGGLVPVIGPKIFFPKVVGPLFFNQPADVAAIDKVVAEELPAFFDYLESQVTTSDAIVGGKFSIGDIGLTSPFVNLSLAGYGVDEKRWPKLARYLAHQFERPSFRALIAEERAAFAAAQKS